MTRNIIGRSVQITVHSSHVRGYQSVYNWQRRGCPRAQYTKVRSSGVSISRGITTSEGVNNEKLSLDAISMGWPYV